MWNSVIDGVLPPDEIMALFEDPLLRLLSDLDPLTNVKGWDSGMLSPGQTYTRRFTSPGTYTYTDGYGHTGKINVPYSIFLPVVVH